MILLELLELLKSFRRHNFLYHVFGNDFPTPLLRTFESVALPRLLNLVIKKVFIGVSAKPMTTFLLSNEEFTLGVILVADFAIDLAFSVSDTSLEIFILLFDY